MRTSKLFFLILLSPIICFAQNTIKSISAEQINTLLSHQKKAYKLVFFWVPKCETTENQYNEAVALQEQSSDNLVILPIAMISTKNYEAIFTILIIKNTN